MDLFHETKNQFIPLIFFEMQPVLESCDQSGHTHF